MKVLYLFRRSLLAAGFALFAATAVPQAQTATQETYKPQVGQAGKDVVWVPTPQIVVDKMLDMAAVTSADYVIDLGSGDGRTVITAARRGAKAHGIEYNPDMVALSQKNAEAAGLSGRATFAKADLFESDFSSATVITMFLLPDINLRLRPKILDLKPGTRIVSNSFTMGDWEADETVDVGGDCQSWCKALFWMVPAKVQGTWKLPQGDLNLTQSYQKITGALRNGTTSTPISAGTLRGEQVSFTAGAVQYTGRVNGNVMEGTMSGGATGSWRATK